MLLDLEGSWDVVGVGPVGTSLLVPKLEGGLLVDVARFGPIGTHLLVPRPNGGVSHIS